MESSARYVLQGALKYAASTGDMNEAEFIEMNAPTGRHARPVAFLRQAIVRAINENSQAEAAAAVESPEPAPTPDVGEEPSVSGIVDGLDIINVMARSSVDLGDVYKVARDLFVLKGVLRVDGEVQMTATLLDNMTAQDFEMIVGSYIANFTLPS